jgi:hypothetical protein
LRHLLLDPAQSETPAKFNIVLAARPLIFAAVRFPFAVADSAQRGFPCHGLGLSLPLAAGIPNAHIARISTCKTIGL